MKWISRSFVFAVALMLGGSAVSIVSMFNGETPYPDISVYDPSLTNSHSAITPDGIKVMYAGWERGKAEGPYLKFIIYNGLDQPITYAGYGPMYPIVEIGINGYFDRIWECQNGTEHFNIEPRGLVEVYVDRYEFYEKRPRKTDRTTVEFYLWTAPDGETEIYTSEPFLLPDDFRDKIPNSVK